MTLLLMKALRSALKITTIRSCLREVINVSLSELIARFTENNDILLALSNSLNMEIDQLKPLTELGVTLPPLHKLKTAKTYIENQRKEWSKDSEGSKKRFNLYQRCLKFAKHFPMYTNYML